MTETKIVYRSEFAKGVREGAEKGGPEIWWEAETLAVLEHSLLPGASLLSGTINQGA